MPVSFDRPVGASADVAELEFISALHQTELQPRKDGTIKAIDIVCFLSSRYGIRVTEEEVKDTIVCGLGGGDDAEFIDIVELVAILCIPELLKASMILFDGPVMDRDRAEFDHDWEYREYRRRYSIMKARQSDPQMIETVLGMILNDATGSSLPKRLDKQLVKDIFSAYGETALVNNDKIIDEMMEAASSDDDEEKGTFLDARAFARALTSDVQAYDVHNETKLSTHYHDVFDTYESTKTNIPHWSDHLALPKTLSRGDGNLNGSSEERNDNDDKKSDGECTNGETSSVETRPVERFFTFPAIDYVAGTYSSKVYVVTLWICGVATYFAYLYNVETNFYRLNCTPVYDENMVPINRGPYFGCRVANGIINWIVIMLELSILGSIFICFGSVGNSVFNSSPILIFIGMLFVALFTIVPFVVEVETPFFRTVHSQQAQEQFVYYMSLILGCALLIMQLKLLFKVLLPEKVLKQHKTLSWLFLPNIVISESNIKQAASFKMSRLLRNALDIHCLPVDNTGGAGRVTDIAETSYGRALLNFSNHGDKSEITGGLAWAWRSFLSGTLQREEGVFLSSQVIAGNVAQAFVCIFFMIFGIAFLVIETNELPPEDPADDFTPKKWMLILSIFIGILAGLIAAVSLVVKCIPSTVCTTLMFRSGVLKSLQDSDFSIFRSAEDQITLIFGSMFWGAFYTTLAIGFFFGLICFAAVWQVTREIFLYFFANIIGLMITLLLKVIILRVLRKAWYAAFYRTQPMKANVLNVTLQSWNIALATGYMLARGLMLLLATMLYIGRIDTPFLAPEVSKMGPFLLDSYPVAFRKAILLNEAHRHPYIERLGFMYMYKLRYGEGFAKTSGSTWRLLFAFALFPWLRKYRVGANPQLKDAGDEEPDRLQRLGTYRVMPKPPPRYTSSIIAGGDLPKDLPALQECAEQEEKFSDGGSSGIHRPRKNKLVPRLQQSGGGCAERGSLEKQISASNSTESAETSELKAEIEGLKRQNKKLIEKVALMEKERIS